MKQIIVFTIILISSACYTYAQETLFKKQYEEAISKKDFPKQVKLLKEWEEYSTNDPELYVAYFNYYVNSGRNTGIGLTTTPPDNEVDMLVLSDSTDTTAGYLYGHTA